MKLQTLKAVAETVASESKCASMKVGAVLVKDGRIVSTGTNGTARGYTNCCDKFSERGPEHSSWSAKFETHAELSALLFSPISIEGCQMVTTHSPCWDCCKAMILSGVEEIWFGERYYRQSDEDFAEVVEYCNTMNVKFGEIPYE